jgi:hypothetical protein
MGQYFIYWFRVKCCDSSFVTPLISWDIVHCPRYIWWHLRGWLYYCLLMTDFYFTNRSCVIRLVAIINPKSLNHWGSYCSSLVFRRSRLSLVILNLQKEIKYRVIFKNENPMVWMLIPLCIRGLGHFGKTHVLSVVIFNVEKVIIRECKWNETVSNRKCNNL